MSCNQKDLATAFTSDLPAFVASEWKQEADKVALARREEEIAIRELIEICVIEAKKAAKEGKTSTHVELSQNKPRIWQVIERTKEILTTDPRWKWKVQGPQIKVWRREQQEMSDQWHNWESNAFGIAFETVSL